MKSYSLDPSFGLDVAPFYGRVNMAIQFQIRPGCLFAALGKGEEGGGGGKHGIGKGCNWKGSADGAKAWQHKVSIVRQRAKERVASNSGHAAPFLF
jgi:hypothetical protein